MSQFLSGVALLVPDYDSAIAWYCGTLGFDLAEDTPLSKTKRWVVVKPSGAQETGFVLAKAGDDRQRAAIGDQAGGRVFLFLRTDDFNSDYARLRLNGVEFLEEPRREPYGTVAVFRERFGNMWDLIEPRPYPRRNPDEA